MARTWPLFPLLTLTLLGCFSDDVPIGEASGGHGSGSSTGVTATSVASATGTIPPTATSTGSSSDDADSTAGTTLAGTTETTPATSGDDFGASDEGTSCNTCCGQGTIDGTEQCDCGMMPCTPKGLDFAVCEGLVNPLFPDRFYTGGILDCSPASCQFNFTACTFCGDRNLNGNETCELDRPPQDTCASLGLGDATEPLPCDLSCQLDTSSCA